MQTASTHNTLAHSPTHSLGVGVCVGGAQTEAQSLAAEEQNGEWTEKTTTIIIIITRRPSTRRRRRRRFDLQGGGGGGDAHSTVAIQEAAAAAPSVGRRSPVRQSIVGDSGKDARVSTSTSPLTAGTSSLPLPAPLPRRLAGLLGTIRVKVVDSNCPHRRLGAKKPRGLPARAGGGINRRRVNE